MKIWMIDRVASIRDFVREFQPEIKEYRKGISIFDSADSLFKQIPGYKLYETDLNSLLDVYESPLGLKNESEIPFEWKRPFQELATLAYFSLRFKGEIKEREYFISRLFASFPEMRFQSHLALSLRDSGNVVEPKFLKQHEDFDMLVVTPSKVEIEIECKTQSEESGRRVDLPFVNELQKFLMEVSDNSGFRWKIVIDCEDEIRVSDALGVIAVLKDLLYNAENPSFSGLINGKRFEISRAIMGRVSDGISSEEMVGHLLAFREKGYRVGFVVGASKELFPVVSGFSFVAVRSALKDRQLLNLVRNLQRAGDYQFSGKHHALVALHLDAEVDIERVTNHLNFRTPFANVIRDYPIVSGFVFSAIDNIKPSGSGYAFGRYVPFLNRNADYKMVGLEIPGLLTDKQFD